MSTSRSSKRRSRSVWVSAVAVYLVCGVMLRGSLAVSAQPGPSKEYQVKAVFLFNFAQFVGWPRSVFARADTPLVIGVLGENPFGAYLDDAVRGEKVDARRLEIRHYRRVEELKACQLLFISRSEADRLETILASLKDRSILIVGDIDDFVQRGGMVQLATAQNKIRLIINNDAAKAANLTISSQLLRSAEIVAPSKK